MRSPIHSLSSAAASKLLYSRGHNINDSCIYRYDITINIHSEIRLFADDILLYRPIKTSNDHRILQNDLNPLTKWADRWLMEFNIPKCKIMQITTHYNKSNFTYKMCTISLDTVTEHDYLDVCLHHKLSWSPHVDRIRNKANRLLGFLKRNLLNASTQIKEYVYKQLLLPSIEYCSAIWDPNHHSDINKLEHYAARFVLNKPWHRQQQNDSLTVMLANLKWPNLENRRKISRFVLLFKIVRKLLIVPNHCLPISATLESTRTHHMLKLTHIQSRIDIYRYSFLSRTITFWNNLDTQMLNR